MSSTRSAARVFDFAARPHATPADAVAYFDAMVRMFIPRELTPAEWAEYGRARAAYVRASIGMAKNSPEAPTPKVRPRERRRRATTLAGDDGPPVTLDELGVVLAALRLAPRAFREMAAMALRTTDDPDGWLALASSDATDLVDQALWRFSDERTAA